ncbi:hypothetical protein [Haloplasma contractile]|uniref:Uncharacterized protein n=1 Tax=Haloplasma contractile SSD-17B TaxID=1033810 RepID=U2E7Y1_9MOLU|nr:hypothetical protein [Haloplasma contractile]ERJ11303.1 hypothetical protein HLPCO_002605 [Haloplasma contractile SSD-17B]
MKKIDYLNYLIVILVMITAGFGLFYTTGESKIITDTIYNEVITLYGDGIYKNDSVFKASVNKGSDLSMLVVVILFLYTMILSSRVAKFKFIQIGLLSAILYYSSCLVFGVTFNRLFLLYVLLFSASLFSMIFSLVNLFKADNISSVEGKPFKGTALFLIICGCSTLVWLQFIIPAIVNGHHLSTIEIYTTEPTFVFDLAIIFPIYIGSAIALLKGQAVGYKMAPILLVFIVIIGLTVICQTIVQIVMDIDIPINQLIGTVSSFVILGVIAGVLTIRYIRFLK